MADILFVTMDGGGNVPPMLGVAAAVAARGHRVRVLGHERLRVEVERAGLPFLAYATAREWDSTREQSAVMWVPMFNDANIRADVRRVCALDTPDVAVVDCMLLPALRAVQDAGIPHVVFTHTFRGYMNGMHRFGAGTAARLYGYRITKMWDSADLNLVATVRDLDPGSRRRPPANARWIGPVVASPALRQRDDPPLVLVSMSTNGFPGQRRTVGRIISALSTLPLRAIVTTGGVLDPDTLPRAGNVEIVGYVDHGELMPKCSLLIGHGGHSSTFRALAHDMPTLVIPASGLSDQRMIGAAVAAAGAGLTLNRWASTTSIRRAIRSLVTEPGWRDTAARTGNVIRTTDAAGDAAGLITDLAPDQP
jgi:UDP:flavonoid glycosyltransferase YjiC (YdhE family)